LQEAKNELAQEYSRLEEETLKENLAEADISFQENNTARAWKVVNKVTNRKARASGKLKGKSPEECTKQWFTHFEKLLGSQEDSDTHTDIEPVLQNLSINSHQLPSLSRKLRKPKSNFVKERRQARTA